MPEAGLAGRTVLSTRAAAQDGTLRTLLESAGAEVIQIPTIEIREPRTWEPVDRAVQALPSYDWVVFTSANAVDAFMTRAGVERTPRRTAVVGAQTAARLRAFGIEPDEIPKTFRAEGLLQALPKEMHGLRVLWPRAEIAGRELPDTLRERGAEVDEITVYRTEIPSQGRDSLRPLLEKRRIDAVLLTSGSTARNLLAMLGGSDGTPLLDGVVIAVIGPVTARVAKECGLRVDVQPTTATIPALVDALGEHFQGISNRKTS